MIERISRACSIAAAALLVITVFAWLSFEIQQGRLTNTDELFTAERSREMLLLGRSAVHLNFQLSFTKPPLQYWLTAWTLPRIDNREFAVRIWPLIFGSLTGLALAWLAFLLDRNKPWLISLSVALLVSCPLFLTETSHALLDSGLMFFTTLMIVFAQLARKQPAWWLAVAVACWLGSLQKFVFSFFAWLIIVVTRVSSTSGRSVLRWWWLAGSIVFACGAVGIPFLIQFWQSHGALGRVLIDDLRDTQKTFGTRPYLEIPFRLSVIWLCGALALLAPIILLVSKKDRRQAARTELSILCLSVIVAGVISNLRSVRYILPIVPCLCLLLAVVLIQLIEHRKTIGKIALLIVFVLSIVGVIQGKSKINKQRRDVSDQLQIAHELGVLQKPGRQIVVLRPVGGEVLYELFYLFYGNLRSPNVEWTPDKLRAAAPARSAIGVCEARDFPIVREKYPDATVNLQKGEFICWRADGG
jgi:4-amino-4-deoxy-L-arabinose transferase-like glycosyltransferase